MEWQKGKFQEFRALREIRMPAVVCDEKPSLEEGEVFQYDGHTLRTADGKEFSVVSLAGGYKHQWYVQSSSTETVAPVTSANIKVRSAREDSSRMSKSLITTHDDQKEVGTIQDRIARRESPAPAPSRAWSDQLSPAGISLLNSLKEVAPDLVGKTASLSSHVGRTSDGTQVERTPEIPLRKMSVDSREDEVVGSFRARVIQSDDHDMLGVRSSASTENMEVRRFSGASELTNQVKVGPGAPQRGTTKTAGGPTKFRDTVTADSISRQMKEVEEGTSRRSFKVIAEDGSELERVEGEPKKVSLKELSTAAEEKIKLAQEFVPGFEWDLSLTPSERVKAAAKHIAKKDWMRAILVVETPAVQVKIRKMLEAAVVAAKKETKKSAAKKPGAKAKSR